MLARIGKVTKQGVQILQGYIIKNNDDEKVVEVNTKISENVNTFYSDTVQVNISLTNRSLKIRKFEANHS